MWLRRSITLLTNRLAAPAVIASCPHLFLHPTVLSTPFKKKTIAVHYFETLVKEGEDGNVEKDKVVVRTAPISPAFIDSLTVHMCEICQEVGLVHNSDSSSPLTDVVDVVKESDKIPSWFFKWYSALKWEAKSIDNCNDHNQPKRKRRYDVQATSAAIECEYLQRCQQIVGTVERVSKSEARWLRWASRFAAAAFGSPYEDHMMSSRKGFQMYYKNQRFRSRLLPDSAYACHRMLVNPLSDNITDVQLLAVVEGGAPFSPSACIFRCQATRSIIVAFRGTACFADWATDFSARSAHFGLHMEGYDQQNPWITHYGLGRAVSGVEADSEDVTSRLPSLYRNKPLLAYSHHVVSSLDNAVLEAVRLVERLKRNDDEKWSLVFAGHSLGASLAQLYHFRFTKEFVLNTNSSASALLSSLASIRSYAFGPAPSANEALCCEFDKLNLDSTAVVFSKDATCRMQKQAAFPLKLSFKPAARSLSHLGCEEDCDGLVIPQLRIPGRVVFGSRHTGNSFLGVVERDDPKLLRYPIWSTESVVDSHFLKTYHQLLHDFITEDDNEQPVEWSLVHSLLEGGHHSVQMSTFARVPYDPVGVIFSFLSPQWQGALRSVNWKFVECFNEAVRAEQVKSVVICRNPSAARDDAEETWIPVDLHNNTWFTVPCSILVYPEAVVDPLTAVLPSGFLSTAAVVTVFFFGSPVVIAFADLCFAFCRSLSQINFGPLPNLRAIGHSFLLGATSLIRFNFESFSGLKRIGDRCLRGAEQLVSVNFNGLSQLQSIGSRFMEKSTAIQSVDFTPLVSLRTIGSYCLAHATSLTAFNMSSLPFLEKVWYNFLEDTPLLPELILPDDSKVHFEGMCEKVRGRKGPVFN